MALAHDTTSGHSAATGRFAATARLAGAALLSWLAPASAWAEPLDLSDPTPRAIQVEFEISDDPRTIGQVYSVLGRLDRAQEWIETAANEGFPCYTLFETDPFLERLRGSPRFGSLVAALRKEWAHLPAEAD